MLVPPMLVLAPIYRFVGNLLAATCQAQYTHQRIVSYLMHRCYFLLMYDNTAAFFLPGRLT
jgi:hypothetical protein